MTNRLFKIIIEELYTTSFDEKVFNQVLELTSSHLKEVQTLPPYKKFSDTFDKLIKPHITSYSEEVTLLGSVNFSEFKSLIEKFRKETVINALFYGHVKTNSLEEIKLDLVKATFKYNSDTERSQILSNFDSVYKIDSPVVYRTNNDLKTEKNHFTANYFQLGVRDIRNYIVSSLLELTWGKEFYNVLRTTKQYGYVVNERKIVQDNVMVQNYFNKVLSNHCARNETNTRFHR